jgi:hypothetical protein
MENLIRPPFTKNTFEELAAIRDSYCISIYLPLQKRGMEHTKITGKIYLKNCLKEIYAILVDYGYKESTVNSYLEPIRNLVDDINFWRNTSKGLAIFLNRNNKIRYFKSPLSFEIKTYVADHFYLIPLLTLFSDNGIYYLLELSRDEAKLYEGSRDYFQEIPLKNVTGAQLESRGHLVKQKVLEYGTGQMMYPAGSFHGQGEAKEGEKKELISRFRKIYRGVNKVLPNKKAPLILACSDEMFPFYKKINSHRNIWDTNLSGAHEFKDKIQLHRESWCLLQNYFERTKRKKLAELILKYHSSKTSYHISEIIQAAVNGRIDTLFVQKETDLFGTFNSKKGCLILDSRKEMRNLSLLNMAATYTFLQGGNVYFLDKEEMPVKNIHMHALFSF